MNFHHAPQPLHSDAIHRADNMIAISTSRRNKSAQIVEMPTRSPTMWLFAAAGAGVMWALLWLAFRVL